ncbi:MAG TPA: hypothetical protein VGY97_09045 [Solirubrobacteraceae bacterium]|nr:hypothetical protein [Solirubrobacteraceae bacterium]
MNSVITPNGVIRPIPEIVFSLNQTSPPGPLVAPIGPLPLVSPEVNSVMVGAAQAEPGVEHTAASVVRATHITGERTARLSSDRTDDLLNPT